MSRSQPVAKNPSQRFMQWSGGKGNINYWDKENEEKVIVELPLTFLVLDELNTITGFSEADHSGFWSNEVKSLKQELVVKTKAGTKVRGKYADISDQLKAMGGKYTKSVYIAFYSNEKELIIGNFKFSGASLTAWIEFNKKFDVYSCAVKIIGSKPEKKGATNYFTPVFSTVEVSTETENESKILDTELQRYLKVYRDQKDEDLEAGGFEEVETIPNRSHEKEVEIEDIKIDLEDVPF